jgi:MFS family permease
MEIEIQKHLRHNLIVNLWDGAFFGLGLGFASFATILPLFVATMTNSPLLIGLIPAIHNAGWQLPQLFTPAGWLASRIKPSLSTTTERFPSWFAVWLYTCDGKSALALTLRVDLAGLEWLTANPWQSMIGKIIPSDRRSTFIGAQAAAANLLASVSAVIAGIILTNLDGPGDYALNFILCSMAMTISWVFLARTREPARLDVTENEAASRAVFWSSLRNILRQDQRFRWFLVARSISQLVMMGAAFYSVFAVQQHGASEADVGLMTGTLLGTAILHDRVDRDCWSCME